MLVYLGDCCCLPIACQALHPASPSFCSVRKGSFLDIFMASSTQAYGDDLFQVQVTRFVTQFPEAPVALRCDAQQAFNITRLLRFRGAGRRAAALFEGKHDFTQFATMTPGAARDPVKRVARCEVMPVGDGALRVEVAGDAFLWKMVRHMVRAFLSLYPASQTLNPNISNTKYPSLHDLSHASYLHRSLQLASGYIQVCLFPVHTVKVRVWFATPGLQPRVRTWHGLCGGQVGMCG